MSKTRAITVSACVLGAFAVVRCGSGLDVTAKGSGACSLSDTPLAGTGSYHFGSTGAAGATATNESDIGHSVLIDPRGRIVVVGSSADAAFNVRLAIWRFNPDGSRDTSFGNSGLVLSGIPGAAGASSGSVSDIGNAAQIDSNGRIVVAGRSANAAGGTELAIWRFNDDGTPDSSFGSGGSVVSGSTGVAGATGSSENDIASAMAIDGAGRIVVLGVSESGVSAQELALWRYNSDGTPDTSFATAGVFISGSTGATGSSGGAVKEIPFALGIDSSGRLVAAGTSEKSGGGGEGVVWRFTSSGQLDGAFGSGGIALLGANGAAGASGTSEQDLLRAVAFDSSGNILAAGSSVNASGGTEVALWRLPPSGTSATSFVGGATGAAGAAGASEADSGYALQVDSQGHYVIAGVSHNAGGGGELAIWRYLPTGSLDTSFGSSGIVVSGSTGLAGATGANESDSASAMEPDCLGRLVVTGQSSNGGSGTEMALWRYSSSGSPD